MYKHYLFKTKNIYIKAMEIFSVDQLMEYAIWYSRHRVPEVQDGFSVKNVSSIDKERIFTQILIDYPEISKDVVLRAMVEESAAVPKRKMYRLYEGLEDWVKEIIKNSNVTFAEYENVSERDVEDWLQYVVTHYDLTNDKTLLQGIALLMHTEPDSYTTENYRC